MKFKILSLYQLFILAFTVSVCGNLAHSQSPPPAPVVVETVKEETLQKPVTLVGTVEPVKKSLIASEVEGVIKALPGREGMYLNQGDVIAEFVTRSLEINIKEAKAAKREAQARYHLANNNLERFEQLQKKGVASIKQYQEAQSEKSAWGARTAQIQAQIEGYEYDLEKSSLTAPFSGYVTKEHTEVGQWVQKGGPLVELIDIETAEISIDVPERYISKIKKDQEASIKIDALPGLILEGQIASLVPQADPKARTFPVKVRIDNKDGVVKSGMVARVSFPIGEPSTVKLVPKDAVVTQNNSHFVYVINEGAAQPLPVSTGMAYEGDIEVIGPIQIGQQVVIRGKERLMPNQPVKIINQDAADQKKVN